MTDELRNRINSRWLAIYFLRSWPFVYFKRPWKQAPWKKDHNGVCPYCGKTGMLSKDHKVSKFLGGSDKAENRQYICGRCNEMKGWLPEEKFLDHVRAIARNE